MLGKTFTKQALIALSDTDHELEPLLGGLVRKEVLGVQADPRSPEHGQYGFLQDLLRRVAYETLAIGRSQAISQRPRISSRHGVEHEVVEVVASHYLDAYEAVHGAPRTLSEIRAKAGLQLARAGERAASLGANEEARALLHAGSCARR